MNGPVRVEQRSDHQNPEAEEPQEEIIGRRGPIFDSWFAGGVGSDSVAAVAIERVFLMMDIRGRLVNVPGLIRAANRKNQLANPCEALADATESL